MMLKVVRLGGSEQQEASVSGRSSFLHEVCKKKQPVIHNCIRTLTQDPQNSQTINISVVTQLRTFRQRSKDTIPL